MGVLPGMRLRTCIFCLLLPLILPVTLKADSGSDSETGRLSSDECGSPQKGVLDFLTFIGISTNIVISAINALNAINSNSNNNNNNNNQNDNDNIFEIMVTNSRRKREVESFRDCAFLWICLHQKSPKDKIASFVSSLFLAKTFSLTG